jgi:anti-anti-sigma factor
VEIMVVVGRIDSTTSPTFEAEILKWVEAQATRYVLELSGVNFMSSAALRVLLSMAKRTSRNGKTVLLAGPTPEVQDIFQIANFTEIFKIVATVDEALALVAAQG